MAKKTKVDNPKSLKNVENTLTRTEQFLEENYKPILIFLGVLVILVGLFYLRKIYLGNKNSEAQSQMYMAERWFEMDSLNLALYGDGNYLGFIDIANDYKSTKAGNMAKYAAGICFLHLGRYEEALEYLTKYSPKEKMIGSLAIGATGDALVELERFDEGIEKYLEAAEKGNNSFSSPLFLMKAGQIYELQEKYPEALSIYERIKNKYPESTEGSMAEKYIARVKVLMHQNQ
ncbi:MAG: tetratricopeptide repeat protein [Bacteroidales bacterium]|nr:tetratricopeptide repeat protein [Bacteroidales bacterium]